MSWMIQVQTSSATAEVVLNFGGWIIDTWPEYAFVTAVVVVVICSVTACVWSEDLRIKKNGGSDE
jgi:hypothetical protein